MTPQRRNIDAMNAMAKGKRETIEMIDGRLYLTDDNWNTVWLRKPTGWRPGHMGPAVQITDKAEADLVRFLAISQASAGP